MKIYESAEDYLEKILMLTERNGEVRSIDIATEMGVTKPSVSIAMKNLRQAGYISMDGAGYITLEPPGLEIATRIYGRHKKLTRFFVALDVDPVELFIRIMMPRTRNVSRPGHFCCSVRAVCDIEPNKIRLGKKLCRDGNGIMRDCFSFPQHQRRTCSGGTCFLHTDQCA